MAGRPRRRARRNGSSGKPAHGEYSPRLEALLDDARDACAAHVASLRSDAHRSKDVEKALKALQRAEKALDYAGDRLQMR